MTLKSFRDHALGGGNLVLGPKEERYAGGECGEVAFGAGVTVRDTTDRGGLTLAFSREARVTFTASLG
jgi:hypothetical protein